MQKILLAGGIAFLAGCGVPPEEDAATKAAAKPVDPSLFLLVDEQALERSQAWQDLLKTYR